MEALIAGEGNGGNTSRCPVCRTPIYREKAGKKNGGQGAHWQVLELKFQTKETPAPEEVRKASMTKKVTGRKVSKTLTQAPYAKMW
jgi:hypothetical protein